MRHQGCEERRQGRGVRRQGRGVRRQGRQVRHTFRSTVIRVTLAVPAGEVRQDPLTLLRLPHQWEGLQESSGGRCKGAEGLPDP